MSQRQSSSAKPTVVDLEAMIQFADDGIVSKTVYSDPRVRLVLFAFDKGQLLTEHTAAVPAILHVLSGRTELTLDDETSEAGPGTLIHIPAHMPHSLQARERMVLLLTLLR